MDRPNIAIIHALERPWGLEGLLVKWIIHMEEENAELKGRLEAYAEDYRAACDEILRLRSDLDRTNEVTLEVMRERDEERKRVEELETVREAAETCLGVDEYGPCFQPSYKYAPLLKEALDKLKEAP